MFTLKLIAITAVISFCLSPLLIWVSPYIGAMDKPNLRKVHQKPVSILGGLAVLISFLIGIKIAQPVEDEIVPLVIGAILIHLLGLVDDIFDLKPIIKLVGQILVSLIVVYHGITIDLITLPFGIIIQFGVLSVPVTILWIVAVTNAINLVDGLDGLASGVTMIALGTIGLIAIFQQNIFIIMICSVLIGSLLGFLRFNFYPAKIFLGDNGALMLGFIIGVLSLLGFKNITLISLLFPIIILGVPFIDMVFAMIRRFLKGRPMMQADKSHLHHKLLEHGYSHPQTVILIYSIALLFSLASVILYLSTNMGAIVMTILILITIEMIVELTGLIDDNYQPVLKLFRRLTK
ncbi:undecaprenyl/decaprenyl-phosphate alpha-N-acetylglucosaminyl 1-phosphate transferase [Macrococcus hajekii]|uniref:Undecaprenyl/decaprenyl-phosphate alpha-N-acetylglucosaminyl 1-phosphate transferase n=1 Tax=Macrococcus hajekii TaxID=198482 RepID=A0A4R6BIQ9_9STAP|nr:MraY family glycosyltransferase [Macrococcus hajekii]TDM01477.1 undecaprenyl/decaprenyl-phosphate alpha-N-acetylglucosaminyl 1-phosphate transferase [Macrococcus hajekii]GGB00288.1 undecaprenyl-phosphate alpha-N-acetylglucosaminyl 1-phosphate transferase [Macrococcus hajekii]